MTANSATPSTADQGNLSGKSGETTRSTLVLSYQAQLIRFLALESISLDSDDKLRKQIARLLGKTLQSLKDDRKRDIAESQLQESDKLIQQWERDFELRRKALVDKSENMISLAERSFLSLQPTKVKNLSSDDLANHIRDLITQARDMLDSGNAASAMSLAREAVDALVGDRQRLLKQKSSHLFSEEVRQSIVDVLSSPSVRVHHRAFELDDIRGLSATAAKQGVAVIKIAVVARAAELASILTTLSGNNAAAPLSADGLRSQSGLNLFRISIHQKCTLYVAAIPMEKVSSQLNSENLFSFDTAEVLDQFGIGLIYVDDINAVNQMEKSAIAMMLLRFSETAMRVTRNRIGLREELISLIKAV
ncbi:MAG: hypothetical protein OEW58_11280 [Gammaproteobacteria bacterium]|nr:hypothetical protein [Gammaproteobacteria bacterium]